MTNLKRFGDLAIGLAALLWAIGAFLGAPSDANPEPSAFFAALAHLCSYQVAGAFAFAALARGYKALGEAK